jgi:CRP-like cAMP-binding protein
MHDIVRQHIIHRLGNVPAHLDEVLLHFNPRTAKRGEQLLREGEVCRHVYFIAQGCLQVYTTNNEGMENTRDIVTEGTWCSELSSFGTGKAATESIRCVEPSMLLCIDRPSFQNLMTTVPAFDTVYKQLLEVSYANSVYRINTLMNLSALDRIRWLMDHRPQLATRVSSKLIASYLNINKDVFSRLKGQL